MIQSCQRREREMYMIMHNPDRGHCARCSAAECYFLRKMLLLGDGQEVLISSLLG